VYRRSIPGEADLDDVARAELARTMARRAFLPGGEVGLVATLAAESRERAEDRERLSRRREDEDRAEEDGDADLRAWRAEMDAKRGWGSYP
jgi:hypothetical protein